MLLIIEYIPKCAARKKNHPLIYVQAKILMARLSKRIKALPEYP